MAEKTLALVSSATSLSTNIHLTEEHLIKSAIAMEEETLSVKQKSVRKEQEALNKERNELNKERENLLREIREKNKTKEITAAQATFDKIGLQPAENSRNGKIDFQYNITENSSKNVLEGFVSVIMNGYPLGNFAKKSIEFPATVIKIDKRIKEIFARNEKLNRVIDFILEERSDIAKKERRAIATLTLRHLGEDTKEGKEFKSSMKQVQDDLNAKLEELEK